jgi:Recombinase zinc beta ribbon domain
MNELALANRAADWRRLKTLVLDSVSSPITKRVYNLGLDEFFAWYGQEPRPGFTKATVNAVPAIVTEATWKKARKALQDNFLFSARGAKSQYLLRGLIKCGLCGLTYIGVAANRPNRKREFYYRCNGAHSPSIYTARGRCAGKAVRGDELEQQVCRMWRRSCATRSRCSSSFTPGCNRMRRAPSRPASRRRGWKDCSLRRRPSGAGWWA